jgi:hypothetical protein
MSNLQQSKTQCEAVYLTEEGNVKLGGLRTVRDKLRDAKRDYYHSLWTSYNAALVGDI